MRLSDAQLCSDSTSCPTDALIRFGSIGADQVADDDDCFIVIAPQNVVGASLVSDFLPLSVSLHI